MSSKHGLIAAVLVVGLAVIAASALGSRTVVGGHPRLTPMMMGSYSTAPATSQAPWHRFRGRVTYRNRAHHWFRMHTGSGASVQIYTNRRTQWDHCGWDDMHMGYRVDVRAFRSHGHWMAARMHSWDDWMP